MGKSKFNRQCIVDFTNYRYCGGCSDYARSPRWMESFCSENCRSIFNIYMKYKAGIFDTAGAKAELQKCDLSKLDQFEEGLKEGIKAILVSPKKAEEVAEIPEVDLTEEPEVKEPTVEETKAEEPAPSEPVTEETKTEDPAQYQKNKNRFNGYNKKNHKR